VKKSLLFLPALLALAVAHDASAQFDCTIGLNVSTGGLDGSNPIIVTPNTQVTLFNLCDPFPGGQATYTWTGPNIQGNTKTQAITATTPSSGTAAYSSTVTAAGKSGTASTVLQVLGATAPICTLAQSPAGTLVTGQAYTLTASCSKTVIQYLWTGTSATTQVVNFTAPATAGNVVRFLSAVGTGGARGPTTSITIPVVVPPPNYQGLWWNAPAGSQSGWGINFAHQGDTLFATWFTFGLDGKPLWLVVAATKTANRVYAGKLYTGTGPAFDVLPFDPSKVVPVELGSATFTFAEDNANATFAYTIDGVSQTKNITRQVFATPVPKCAWGGNINLALATNYQDIWWASPAGSESGWGINFNHQGDTIFATWFTFGRDGKPVWYVVGAQQTASGTFAGKLYTGTGPPYNAVPYDPSLVVPTEVGSVTLTFTDGNNATFAYTVDGVTQSKLVTREIFGPPGTLCQ
jgi:hypothetical protein